MDRVSAALVLSGGASLLLAMALLVLGHSGSTPGLDDGLDARFQIALILAGVALASTSTGVSRAAVRLQADQLPRPWQSIAAVIAGLFGLLLVRGIFDWPQIYLPTDARSQPGNVLAGALFFGFGAAVVIVLGAVLLVARIRARS